jgi:ribose transport system permease protein
MTAAAASRERRLPSARRLAPYGSVLVLLLGIVVFSLLRPDSFATIENLRAILSEEAVLAFAALGITIPLIAGQFDLSIGGVIGFTGLLAVGLMSFSGMPWLLAALLGLLAGTAVGLVNGLLVAYGGIHSFVATLATGTLVYGAQLWYSRGEIIFDGVSTKYVSLTRTEALGFTLPVFYTAVLALGLWFVLTHTPFGRYLYAIGGNQEAAEVAGVRVKRHIVYSLTLSGTLAGAAGLMLASRTASAQSAQGDTFLLPAFAAAFIGAATFRRGEFNVAGTLVGVFLVAVLVTGAFQLGAREYVAPLITGAALLLAVMGNRFLVSR